jgi:hypothetical protein
MHVVVYLISQASRSHRLTGPRRADGRRAQEATARPVKMIGPTRVSVPSPTARWDGDRSRINEDQASVGPLLEPWKARGEHRHSGEHVLDADDGHEVSRVAQVPHDPDEGW